MSPTRIGLFGGTFDPPHIGHLILASEAAFQFKLEKLLWVLTPDPPHKQSQSITPVEHRIAMVQKTIDGNPIFELSRIDLDRPGPHYMVDTVNLFLQQESDTEIVLLIGGDSLRDIPTWNRASQLISIVHKLGVLRRPGDAFDMDSLEKQIPGITKKTHFIDGLLHNLSSSAIRIRVQSGQPYRYYILQNVYEYIEANHLYKTK